MVNQKPGLLSDFAGRSDVKAALADLDRRIVELRFTEGLRRNWAPARAEASIQLAQSEALMDGARADLAELRLASIGRVSADGAADPSQQIALDYWHAHHWVEGTWPPLNTRRPVRVVEQPLPRVLGQVHKLLTARLASMGKIPEAAVAIPSRPESVLAMKAVLESSLPAPIRAGLLIWYAGQSPAFETHSVPLARVLARHHLVTCGFEPTGTLLTSVELARNPLAQQALADPEPFAWLLHYIDAMSQAVDASLQMIRHVQAGKLPE